MTRKVDQWSGFRFKVSPSDTRALSSPPTITIWSVASLRFLGVYACVLVVVYNREQVERQLQGLPNTKRKRRHRLLRANLFGQRLNWYRHNLRIPSGIYPTWKAKGAEEDVVVHYCRLTLIPPSPLLGCKWWEIETIEMNWIQKKIVALFFFIVANRQSVARNPGHKSRPNLILFTKFQADCEHFLFCCYPDGKRLWYSHPYLFPTSKSPSRKPKQKKYWIP